MTENRRSAEQELAFLTQALRGHLEWAANTGADGVLPLSDEWLKQRRDQYRQRELTAEEAAELTWGDAAPETSSVPAEADPSSREQSSPSANLASALAPPSPPTESGAAKLKRPEAPAPKVERPTRPALHPLKPGEALSDQARQRLRLLQEEVRDCTRCGLHEQRTNTVFARGDGSSGVCFIGEGPGQDEDEQGLPFVGKAGQLLDKMIVAMGLSRDTVYICNIVKCRPPRNRKPEPQEMQACREYLEEQLQCLQPKVIVALGSTAVQGLLGVTMGITRLRGQWRLYKGRIPVMPTFHPAYLLRQPGAKREVWSDLQEVLKHLQA